MILQYYGYSQGVPGLYDIHVVGTTAPLHTLLGSFDQINISPRGYFGGGHLGQFQYSGDRGSSIDLTRTDGSILNSSVPLSLSFSGRTGLLELGGGGGDDTITGGLELNLLQGGEGSDILNGSDGRDDLFGQEGDDTLVGGSGGDWVEGGWGRDILNGGSGDDIYFMDEIDVLLDSDGFDRVMAETSLVLTSGVEIEFVQASYDQEPYVLTGNEFGQTVSTYDGADTLSGMAGEDTLIGNGGDDHLFGGAGADSLEGGDDADRLHGGDGADTLAGGDGNDRYFSDGADTIVETGGVDTIYVAGDYALADALAIETLRVWGTGAHRLTGNASANALLGAVGADTLVGGGGTDALTGMAGADSLIGDAGADRLTGGVGADTMSGAGGDDLYFADGEDMIVEGADGGYDRVIASGDLTIDAGVAIEMVRVGTSTGLSISGNTLAARFIGAQGDDTLIGGGGDDTLAGGDGDDSLTGFDQSDRLDGGAGRDTLAGALGDDVYTVDDQDLIVEASGGGFDRVLATSSLTLSPDAEIEVVRVAAGPGLQIIGTAGVPLFIGSSGADTLVGGEGRDTLVGGDGEDRFVFRGVDDSLATGPDLIRDFVGGIDRIDLSALEGVFYIGASDFSGSAGELRWEAARGSTLLQLDLDGDRDAEFAVRLLGVTSLTLNDFDLGAVTIG